MLFVFDFSYTHAHHPNDAQAKKKKNKRRLSSATRGLLLEKSPKSLLSAFFSSGCLLLVK